MAVQFKNQNFTFTQPDGSKIQLRGSGNQHYAVFETLDGHTVTRNPATGYYELARLSADGNALEPTSGPNGRLNAAGTGVARGLRVRPEGATAAAAESVRRMPKR